MKNDFYVFPVFVFNVFERGFHRLVSRRAAAYAGYAVLVGDISAFVLVYVHHRYNLVETIRFAHSVNGVINYFFPVEFKILFVDGTAKPFARSRRQYYAYVHSYLLIDYSLFRQKFAERPVVGDGDIIHSAEFYLLVVAAFFEIVAQKQYLVFFYALFFRVVH